MRQLTKDHWDVVIIGSGMGGLVCGDILSREGYSVCVLEKNSQIGGCLQTYARDKVVFDAGVHYLGGLDKGQNLHQVFSYLGILEKLKLRKMDPDVFDRIVIGNDQKEYSFAQGYENFIQKLLSDFPGEEMALRAYCDKIKEVCSKFPLYNLRAGGDVAEKADVLEIGTKAFIDSVTGNRKLREVLAGNNILYAGRADKTPFYVHALILNSYIESSWKCISGGSQIGKTMAKNIRERGGIIHRNCRVEKIGVENEHVSYVVTNSGSNVYGKQFISNIHPVQTLEMTGTTLIKKAFRNRLNGLENSISCFTLNIVFKAKAFSYFEYNYYYVKEGCTWSMGDYTSDNWPLGYVFFLSEGKTKGYADSMTVLTYMRYDEVRAWENTYNTTLKKDERGTEYEAFKVCRAEKLIDRIAEKFPGIRHAISRYYTATPLSYRDYIGTSDGSMYGIIKDYNDPAKTLIAARTKLPNLFFTGQNLNLHGILGATISALATCTEVMGNDSIIEKIKNA